jgi:hypothetical protein
LVILLLVTTSQIRTLTRRTAVVLAAALLPLIAAGPAGAEVPEGWSDPEPVSLLSVLVVIVAIPLGIGLLITLGVYGPALARGEHVAPGSDTPDQWFGGPRQSAELEAGSSSSSSSDADSPTTTTTTTGGGSGTW